MTDTAPPTLASMLADLAGDRASAAACRTPEDIDRHQADAMADLLAGFDRMPSAMEAGGGPSEPYLVACGFAVHGPVDDLLLKVTPPPGWSMTPAWTDSVAEVRDERARLRFHMHYKAAAYDRRAEIRPACRFSLGILKLGADGEPMQGDGPFATGVVVVRDSDGTSVYRGDPVPNIRNAATPAEREAILARLDEQDRLTGVWLAANHPGWRDPTACWAD